jgi:hypothetical protein
VQQQQQYALQVLEVLATLGHHPGRQVRPTQRQSVWLTPHGLHLLVTVLHWCYVCCCLAQHALEHRQQQPAGYMRCVCSRTCRHS